jgi:predicted AAA+ superfamily ATPase
VKSPKIYLTDTGLAAFLMGLDHWEAIEHSPMAGPLWETYVVMEVMKHFASTGRSVPLWYWRTAYGAEVDLLIEQGGRFIAVEAKFAENPDQADLKGFQALENFYGEKSMISGWLACRTSH